MYLFDLWPVAIVPTVAWVQWWATRRAHRKQLAAARARHLSALQAAAKMLRKSRQQVAELQRELAAARLTARRLPRAASPSSAAAPVDGFADTMPSQQFSHTSAFGSL
ncbi:MAG TPA: hypothetical protein VJ608_12140 [Albitalea sp.]|nr:hypothetical protein [Albitalea sp.]